MNNEKFFKFAVALLLVCVATSVVIIVLTSKETYNRGFKDGKYYCEVMNARIQNNNGYCEV